MPCASGSDLVNYELISRDYNYDNDDVFHFGAAPAITCNNKGGKNSIKIIGTVREKQRIIGNFLGSAGKNHWWIILTLGVGLYQMLCLYKIKEGIVYTSDNNRSVILILAKLLD